MLLPVFGAVAVILGVAVQKPSPSSGLSPSVPAQSFAQPATAIAFAASSTSEDLWTHADNLMRRGLYADAEMVYESIAEMPAEPDAPLARLHQARAALADARPHDAAATLEFLLELHGGTSHKPAALFMLGVARRTAGNWESALEAFLEYEANAGPDALGPYLALQRANCYAALGQYQNVISAAHAALAIEEGGSRLAKIDVYERAADAYLKLGLQREAFEMYQGALELAATRGYRAEMLFNTGVLLRELGEQPDAISRLRAVVVDYPEQARAPTALRHLEQLGAAGSISPYQAGLVHFNSRDYTPARVSFEQVDASNPDWGDARFNHAVALLRLGDEAGAIAEMLDLAERDPSWAGVALLRAGRLYESEGHYAEAEQVYLRLLELAPSSTHAPEALVRLGQTRYLRDDLKDAVAAWQMATDETTHSPSATIQAQAHFWRGKALEQIGSAAAAQEAWLAAATITPGGYYGLRAADMLAGLREPLATTVPVRDVAALFRDDLELEELATWLGTFGLDPEMLREELLVNPSFSRADELMDLGLRAEALWEYDAARRTFSDAGDVPRLLALADWLLERDLPHLALQVGNQERSLMGVPLTDLPQAIQKHVYPAGWGDLVFEHSERNGVDPFLLMGLIRQESTFNPRAQSSARAMGLTQVIPSTGQGIARALGRADTFQTADLFKPDVSLEFGSWYMAQQLQTYGGRILPALAAYNAGGGNVNRWLSMWGHDPDLFVEQIPFAETYGYVKVVYENYRAYERLYGH